MLGRQDYDEPEALRPDQLVKLEGLGVRPRNADKVALNNWHEVHRDGQLLGYVTTRISGQMFRTPELEFWVPAVDDWCRADPPHAHAILQLITATELTR